MTPRREAELGKRIDANLAAVGGTTRGEDQLLNWRADLLRNKNETIIANLANAITPLRDAPEWMGLLRWNAFACEIEVNRDPPWGALANGCWTDQEDRKYAEWLQRAGVNAGVEVAGLAVQTVAMENAYNPVHDYLDSLKWDGVKRIDTWLSLYLGAEPNDFRAAIGARWLTAAVARVLSAGPVKSDCALVLEGKQGTFKSTAAETLFKPWFTDHMPTLDSKDAYIQLAGTWCVELAEMDTIRRSEASRVKAFLSSAVDRYRMPYGRRAIDVPRRCVFIGTVNKPDWNSDETGCRRFWPVRCGIIRVEELARDRDRLWAEAVTRYRAGGRWWLDSPELNGMAEEEQAERYEGGVWDDVILPWLEHPRATFVGESCNSNEESVTIADVLLHCIGKARDKWTQADKNAVARCLAHAGWTRSQVRTAAGREWRYRRLEV